MTKTKTDKTNVTELPAEAAVKNFFWMNTEEKTIDAMTRSDFAAMVAEKAKKNVSRLTKRDGIDVV